MNAHLISLEIWVIALGLVLMLADFWMPAERKRFLGYAAAAALALLLVTNLGNCATGTAFNGMFVQDGLAVFFKRFFLVAAILVLFMSVEFFRPYRIGHFRVLFNDRFCAGGNAVRGIRQQLRDAFRFD